MTVGSLFAGIGGFDLGLERAGFRVVWQVERNPFRQHVLARHWPQVHRREDVRFAGAHNLAAVDCIVGGFPCTDVSCAGKGAGVEHGSRSGLWREFARVVTELRPRWVVVENVPALRTRGADLVLGDLEAAGYTCWPAVVGAHHVGAPHRRDRVWIIARLAPAASERRDAAHLRADAESERAGARRLPDDTGAGMADPNGDPNGDPVRRQPGRGGRENGADSSVTRDDGDLAHSHSHGREGERPAACEESARGHEPDGCGQRQYWPSRPGQQQHEWEPPRCVESPVGRGAHGLSTRLAQRRRVNELAALGDAVVPQVAELIGRTILAMEATA